MIAVQLPNLLQLLHDLASSHNIQSTLLLLPSRANLTKSSEAIGRRGEALLDLPSDTLTGIASGSSPDTPYAYKALPTSIPTCFSSKSACQNTTNSCSGHGSCVKSVANAKCFQCKCTSTMVGTNKWYWGGKACQKKDVSVPFFLFASFGVVMTALIAGGIGLLYGMGTQELPSVLSAGVGGPRAQK